MTVYVADTHAIYWYFAAPERLGDEARRAFDDAASGAALILVPAIVLAELHYLLRKRGDSSLFGRLYMTLMSTEQFRVVPVEAAHVEAFDELLQVSEMHDRLIVAIARRAGAVCISKDRDVTRRGGVPVIW